MLDYTQYLATRLRRLATPQREPISGSMQAPNAAGGQTAPLRAPRPSTPWSSSRASPRTFPTSTR
jgi:hypothetical protein